MNVLLVIKHHDLDGYRGTERCDVPRNQLNVGSHSVADTTHLHEFVRVRNGSCCFIIEIPSSLISPCFSALRLSQSVCAVVSFHTSSNRRFYVCRVVASRSWSSSAASTNFETSQAFYRESTPFAFRCSLRLYV